MILNNMILIKLLKNLIKRFLFDIIFIFILIHILYDQLKTYDYEIKKMDCPVLKGLKQAETIRNYNDSFLDFEAFDNEKGTNNDYIIPNIFHYLIYKNDSTTNYYELTYSHYLSILSIIYFQQPQYVYLHYYGDDIEFITGEYWNKLMDDKNFNKNIIRINKINYSKSKTIFEQKIVYEKHISDLLRLEILIHYGGIYLDTDVILFNSIDYFRTFEISLFSTLPSSTFNINNSIIISNRNARFLKAYHDSFRYFSLFFFHFDSLCLIHF